MNRVAALFCLLFFFCVDTGKAQSLSSAGLANYNNSQQFMNDAFGRPLYMHADYAIEGSPYFSDEYCLADVKVRKGKLYESIKVKLNFLESFLVYDAGDGKAMVANAPIERISFTNCNGITKNKIFRSGYPKTDTQDENSFYEVIDSGEVQLLKYYKVNYNDVKYYGAPNTTRVFEKKEILYALISGMDMKQLSKDNESVITMLSKNQNEIRNFIASNDIKCRKEEDLIRLFRYYNSLNR